MRKLNGPGMASMLPDRRRRTVALGLLAAAVALPVLARTRLLTDSAGRQVSVPDRIARVFPAGPPAAIWLYTLAPQTLLGWPRANRAEELEFLLPGVGDRPELGRLTGRGNTANLETVLALKPDLIVDTGSVRNTFIELADRVQSQTGIPYALVDGRLEAVPAGYRLLGELLGVQARADELARYAAATLDTVKERVARVPRSAHPRVFYARGPLGLETGLSGSINVEMFSAMGVGLVTDGAQGGLATVAMEQVLAWDPEVIITIDQSFAAGVASMPLWRGVSAVRQGRVHLSPKLPFGWVDFPPSVNRIPGLWWLGSKLFPDRFPEDVADVARDFYRRFYQVDLSSSQLQRLLAGRS